MEKINLTKINGPLFCVYVRCQNVRTRIVDFGVWSKSWGIGVISRVPQSPLGVWGGTAGVVGWGRSYGEAVTSSHGVGLHHEEAVREGMEFCKFGGVAYG